LKVICPAFLIRDKKRVSARFGCRALSGLNFWAAAAGQTASLTPQDFAGLMRQFVLCL